MKVKEFHQKADYQCELVTGTGNNVKITKDTPSELFIPKNRQPKRMKIPGEVVDIAKDVFERQDQLEEVNEETDRKTVFPCTRPFCVAKFPCDRQLQEHYNGGRCYESVRDQPIANYLRVRYFLHWGSFSANKSSTVNFKTHLELLECPEVPQELLTDYQKKILEEGFALKTTPKSTVLTEEQKDFLYKIYCQGMGSNQKLDPETTHQRMREEKDEDGNKKFWSKDYLKVGTIRGQFGKFTANLKQGNSELNPDNFNFRVAHDDHLSSEAQISEAIEDNTNIADIAAREEIFEDIDQGTSDNEDDICPMLVRKTLF